MSIISYQLPNNHMRYLPVLERLKFECRPLTSVAIT